MGTKRTDAGMVRRKTSAHTAAMTPTAPIDQRQEWVTWRTPSAARRPSMPPMPLPATYRPIAPPSEPGCTSSERYDIAVAWSPASARPWSRRRTRRTGKFGAKAEATPKTAAAPSASDIIVVRFQASESAVSGMTPMAIASVATETLSEAPAGERSRSCAREGRSAWTQ
ncbi:hypothetical protein GA0115246_103973 [Streptomyces sp. SolWspMP-sol7th]|nr:hypothetical protein GA0115246_103973 [Streptomyces sp. SolWspMP-sol7th]